MTDKLDAATHIEIGDQVCVEFWSEVNDVKGEVLYIPSQPNDSWIIRADDRLVYVQHFAAMSKQLRNDDDDTIF